MIIIEPPMPYLFIKINRYGIGIISIGHGVTKTDKVKNRTTDLSHDLKKKQNQQFHSIAGHIPGWNSAALQMNNLSSSLTTPF